MILISPKLKTNETLEDYVQNINTRIGINCRFKNDCNRIGIRKCDKNKIVLIHYTHTLRPLVRESIKYIVSGRNDWDTWIHSTSGKCKNSSNAIRKCIKHINKPDFNKNTGKNKDPKEEYTFTKDTSINFNELQNTIQKTKTNKQQNSSNQNINVKTNNMNKNKKRKHTNDNKSIINIENITIKQ